MYSQYIYEQMAGRANIWELLSHVASAGRFKHGHIEITKIKKTQNKHTLTCRPFVSLQSRQVYTFWNHSILQVLQRILLYLEYWTLNINGVIWEYLYSVICNHIRCLILNLSTEAIIQWLSLQEVKYIYGSHSAFNCVPLKHHTEYLSRFISSNNTASQ